MNLYTGCPQCRTTFRVTTQQLQASGGQVRCGYCSQVFDAFATLTAQEPVADAVATETAAAMASSEPVAAEPGIRDPAARETLPERKAPAAGRPDPAASLYEWEFRMPQAPKRTGLWFSLAVLLALVLAAQATYVFRTELAVRFPQWRDALSQACGLLGCSLEGPSLAAFLHIESSDLKAVDASVPNEIELTISIRNRAPVELAPPAFELTLTNALNEAIARRVFLPAEYLSAAQAAGKLKPGAELPVHLYLDSGPLQAAGYRLYLFYP